MVHHRDVREVSRGVMFGGSHDVRNVGVMKHYTLEKIRGKF